MKLSVIGASGTFPTPGHPSSGYLITQGHTRVWCEAGPGTFVNLPVDPDLIDAVFLSHEHPDHCLDLLTAYHAFRYRPEPRLGIPVFAPQSTIDRVSDFVDSDEFAKTFDLQPLVGGHSLDIGELRLTVADADHSVPGLVSRWEGNGRVLVFTGDTGASGSWPDLVKDCDLFLSEASQQGRREDHAYRQHLTAAEAGAIARQQGAKALMLTHIPPYLDKSVSVAQAEEVFDRPVELAVTGLNRKV